jgi:hypothetical protein
MSTFVDKATNPKTKKIQEAWFIDDFYGQHQYAIAFRKDGEDVVFSADKIKLNKYDVYPIYEVEAIKVP